MRLVAATTAVHPPMPRIKIALNEQVETKRARPWQAGPWHEQPNRSRQVQEDKWEVDQTRDGVGARTEINVSGGRIGRARRRTEIDGVVARAQRGVEARPRRAGGRGVSHRIHARAAGEVERRAGEDAQ